MRYVLLLYADTELAQRTSADEAAVELAAYAALTAELEATSFIAGGEALLPRDTASAVTVRGGEREVSSVEPTATELSGFYVLECDQQQALDIAAQMPVARHGHVEVRPVMALPHDYSSSG